MELPKKQLEHDMIMNHDISSQDLQMLQLATSSYNNTFEEELDLRQFDPTKSTTVGIICSKDEHIFHQGMQSSTPVAKIQAWHSPLRGAQNIKVNDVDASSQNYLAKAVLALNDSGVTKCHLLMVHSALRNGLVELGIE